MVFTSPVFLFLFLPVVIIGSLLVGRRLQNAFLLAMSLGFYVWGEQQYAIVMLISIAMNWAFGLFLQQRPESRGVFTVAIIANLALLVAFKYANFLADNANVALALLGIAPVTLAAVHLPIGISFYTFHALSYLFDIRRGKARALRNPVDFGLYITLFPQLIAGPIIRYHFIASQLVSRTITLPGFAVGVRRFVVGLAKKMLIANTVAVAADAVFDLPTAELTLPVAWLGAACYMLQIYFDFSGYTDMAIGLGAMLGFRFPENFDYPYVSRSITEFWRRWHITLSTWFRDYLYVPMGGNRVPAGRVYLNLVTVFVFCGLWHGASWTFLVWGLFHGAFLVAERRGLAARLERLPALLRHGYALLAVLVGWVFFRATSLAQALHVLAAMVGLGHGSGAYHLRLYVGPDLGLAMAIGVVGSAPIVPWASRWWAERATRLGRRGAAVLETGWSCAELASLAGLLVASAARVAAGTYNPFIYFRF